MLTKIESTMWSDAQEESEEGKAAAAAAIAANSTPPAVRDPLQIYSDASTLEYRMVLALRKIEPHPDNVTKRHGKRSSSQGRKNTSVHELGDSHNVISDIVLMENIKMQNHALYAFLIAVVLLFAIKNYMIIQH